MRSILKPQNENPGIAPAATTMKILADRAIRRMPGPAYFAKLAGDFRPPLAGSAAVLGHQIKNQYPLILCIHKNRPFLIVFKKPRPAYR
jgi:hypothetical protein